MTQLQVPVNDLALALAVLEVASESDGLPSELQAFAARAVIRLKAATEGLDFPTLSMDECLHSESTEGLIGDFL